MQAIELISQFRMLCTIFFHTCKPGIAEFLAAFADAVLEVIVDAVGDKELSILRPAVVALGQADFLFAERFAVGGTGVLLVGSTEGNVAIDDDERRTIARG